MAKKVVAHKSIKTADDLVTSKDKTRAGFVTMALEKNYLAIPYIEEAKALKLLASQVNNPYELLNVEDLRAGLLTASGLSDKSLNHLTEEDKTIAIKGLIKEFLDPAGENFADELIYRYLLTKGDTLGGKARNLAGALGERKFIRALISVFNLGGINYQWKDSESNSWLSKPEDDSGIEKRIKGFYWLKKGRERLLLMNIFVPAVKKNIDLTILNGAIYQIKKNGESIINDNTKYIALGELKGGVDPAGADEHWKTAKSALIRIRNSFKEGGLYPNTFFIGAAIEKSMATEMLMELQSGVLNNAANLTNDEQLTSICEWIINL